MKKLSLIVAIVLAVTLVLLSACSKNQQNSSSSKNSPNGIYSQDNGSGSSNSDSQNGNQNGNENGNQSGNQNSNQTGNENSSSSSSGGNSSSQTPAVGEELNFAQRFDARIEGSFDSASAKDEAFLSYYKSLGEYEFNPSLAQNAIFASPNGNGDGSLNSPYSLQEALDEVQKGQTLYLRGGTYTPSSYDGYFVNAKGDSQNYVTIRNYPNETPIITNPTTKSESYAFQFDAGCQYIVFEGIEIYNVTAKSAHGIAMWGNGQNHLILRNLTIHEIKTTSSNPQSDTNSGANGILLFGEQSNPISHVIIANNELYDNVTGWAETLSVTANCEYVYVIENEVHDITNIGIDFYGNAGYCSTASLDQPRFCIASGNVIYNSFCDYADCAGLYVDGSRDIILQQNLIYNCQFGIEVGSEEKQTSYPVKNILVRNNIVKNNSMCGIRVGGYETSSTGVVYSTKFINNTLYNNTTSNESWAGEIVIAKVDGISFINNLVYGAEGNALVRTDFSSNYSKNITFYNNYFFAGNNTNNYKFNMFEDSQTGVSAFNSLLNATTITGATTLDNDLRPSMQSVVANAGTATNCGYYDFYLNQRVNGVVEIGAVEIN